jgi:hypothetical protein
MTHTHETYSLQHGSYKIFKFLLLVLNLNRFIIKYRFDKKNIWQQELTSADVLKKLIIEFGFKSSLFIVPATLSMVTTFCRRREHRIRAPLKFMRPVEIATTPLIWIFMNAKKNVHLILINGRWRWNRVLRACCKSSFQDWQCLFLDLT